VPVHPSANCADVHFLVLLYFPPAQLTVRHEELVSFFLLLFRNVFIAEQSLASLDVEDFLSAKGTVGVISPPFDETFSAEDVTTSQSPSIFIVAAQTNDTFSLSCLSTRLGF
jgi:hypothetical protein